MKGSDTLPADRFGTSVAISGTTIVVGVYDHAKDAGRAYVFTKAGSTWNQSAELKGFDTVAADYFGWSVAVSGTTVVVGAVGHAKYAGRAYVFRDTVPAGPRSLSCRVSDTVTNSGFGTSVAVSGTTAVVGAEGYAHGRGRVYVFTDAKTRLDPGRRAEGLRHDCRRQLRHLGGDLAHDGSRGGLWPGQQHVGRAYVFSEKGGVWTQTAELSGADTQAGDYFGISTAISGPTLVVGPTTTPRMRAGPTCSPGARPAGKRRLR